MKHFKLLLASIAILTGGGIDANAQTDVTSQYLTNADFSQDSPVTRNVCGYKNDISKNENKLDGMDALYWAQDVTGWTVASSKENGKAGAVFAYGSKPQLRGDKKAAPATNPSGEASGNALGFFAVWGGTIQYTQDAAKALPAGHYELTYTYYNQSSTNAVDNLIGFKATDGTTHYGTTTSFTAGAWTTETISFDLFAETSGTFSIGYKSKGGESGANPMLFIDNLTLTYKGVDEYSYASQSSDLLVNGKFDTANSGWTLSNMGYQNNNSNPSKTRYIEKWAQASLQNITASATQTVSNLPAGAYLLKATVNAQLQSNLSLDITGVTLSVNDETINCSGPWKDYDIVYELKEPGDITVTFTSDKSNANWISCDEFSLTYGGSDYQKFVNDKYAADNKEIIDAYNAALAAAKAALINTDYANVTGQEKTNLNTAVTTYGNVTSDYQAATAALTAATATFTAAKTAYDNYAEEKSVADKLGAVYTTPTTAAEAESVLHAMNVAEYEAVTSKYTAAIDLGAWTTEGTANFNNEHWSGTVRNYLNQDDSNNGGWNSNAWAMSASQTLTLPAGTYVFKAAGRKSANATMKLEVANGETPLAVVTNFPNGSVGLGITTDGEASFETEGKTYANKNQGYGWQWRFAPFTLTEETEVTISVTAGATSIHQWASFGDYTVQAIPSAESAKAIYTQAYNNAHATLEDETYKNVTGSERTAVEAFPETPAGTTMEAINGETDDLNQALDAFKAAKPSYDALVNYQALAPESLPYADATKVAAMQTAVAYQATSATDAVTALATAKQALRTAVESNSLAEGVEGRVDYTGSIQNPNAESAEGWTLAQGDGGASINVKLAEAYTDAEGNSQHNYFDGGNWGGNDWTTKYEQSVTSLPAGKYLVAVTARGSQDLRWFQLYANNKKVDLTHINGDTETGVFGRGWNDGYLVFTTNGGDVTIGVTANAQRQYQWQSFSRFRLVKIGDLEQVTLSDDATEAPAKTNDYVNVTYDRTLYSGWNSIVLPFDATLTELGAEKAYSFAGTSKVEGTEDAYIINLTAVGEDNTLKANTPYIVKMTADKTDGLSFDARMITPSDQLTSNGEGFSFVGTYVTSDETIVKGDYIVGENGFKLALGGNRLGAFRAYLKNAAPEANEAKGVTIDGEEVTGIESIAIRSAVTGKAYNLQGQQVSTPSHGIFIIDGKKVVLK